MGRECHNGNVSPSRRNHRFHRDTAGGAERKDHILWRSFNCNSIKVFHSHLLPRVCISFLLSLLLDMTSQFRFVQQPVPGITRVDRTHAISVYAILGGLSDALFCTFATSSSPDRRDAMSLQSELSEEGQLSFLEPIADLFHFRMTIAPLLMRVYRGKDKQPVR